MGHRAFDNLDCLWGCYGDPQRLRLFRVLLHECRCAWGSWIRKSIQKPFPEEYFFAWNCSSGATDFITPHQMHCSDKSIKLLLSLQCLCFSLAVAWKKASSSGCRDRKIHQEPHNFRQLSLQSQAALSSLQSQSQTALSSLQSQAALSTWIGPGFSLEWGWMSEPFLRQPPALKSANFSSEHGSKKRFLVRTPGSPSLLSEWMS